MKTHPIEGKAGSLKHDAPPHKRKGHEAKEIQHYYKTRFQKTLPHQTQTVIRI